MPRETAATIGRFIELLELADDFCRAERLLSLARTPEQRRFQRWFLSEFVRQEQGEPPTGVGRCARVEAAEQRFVSPALPAPRLVIAVAVGGALGALLRWGLTEVFPDAGRRLPVGDLRDQRRRLVRPGPAAGPRRRTAPPDARGRARPGVLGGFTTLSAYSEQSRALLAAGHTGLAASYLLGTLGACLLAVVLADRWPTP